MCGYVGSSGDVLVYNLFEKFLAFFVSFWGFFRDIYFVVEGCSCFLLGFLVFIRGYVRVFVWVGIMVYVSWRLFCGYIIVLVVTGIW